MLILKIFIGLAVEYVGKPRQVFSADSSGSSGERKNSVVLYTGGRRKGIDYRVFPTVIAYNGCHRVLYKSKKRIYAVVVDRSSDKS